MHAYDVPTRHVLPSDSLQVRRMMAYDGHIPTSDSHHAMEPRDIKHPYVEVEMVQDLHGKSGTLLLRAQPFSMHRDANLP